MGYRKLHTKFDSSSCHSNQDQRIQTDKFGSEATSSSFTASAMRVLSLGYATKLVGAFCHNLTVIDPLNKCCKIMTLE